MLDKKWIYIYELYGGGTRRYLYTPGATPIPLEPPLTNEYIRVHTHVSVYESKRVCARMCVPMCARMCVPMCRRMCGIVRGLMYIPVRGFMCEGVWVCEGVCEGVCVRV